MEELLERSDLPLYNVPMEVFLLDLNTLRGREDDVLPLLTPDRRRAALRRKGEVSRLQCIGAGLLLRYVFGERIPRHTAAGKPFFPGEKCFSLSHSGMRAVLAADRTEVGTDVQAVTVPRDALMKRVLTAEELRWIQAAGRSGFAFLWSRKEAVLKCLGTGVDRSLASFSVLPGERPTLDGQAFSLHTVDLGEYMLSAASGGESAFFTLRELSPEELTAREVRKDGI